MLACMGFAIMRIMQYAINCLWILIVLGDLLFLIIFLYQREKAKARQAWPETVGKILKTQIKINEVTESSGLMEFAYALFNFQYQVSGSEFQGQFVISPEFRLLFQRDLLSRAIAKHPIGSSIRVKYNPEDPTEHITDYDTNSHHNILTGMIVWTFLLLLMIVVGSSMGG